MRHCACTQIVVGRLKSGAYCRTAPRMSQHSRGRRLGQQPPAAFAQGLALTPALALSHAGAGRGTPRSWVWAGRPATITPIIDPSMLRKSVSHPAPALPLPLECSHPSAIQCLSSITDIARKVRAGRAGGARSGCAQRGSARRFIPWVSWDGDGVWVPPRTTPTPAVNVARSKRLKVFRAGHGLCGRTHDVFSRRCRTRRVRVLFVSVSISCSRLLHFRQCAVRLHYPSSFGDRF